MDGMSLKDNVPLSITSAGHPGNFLLPRLMKRRARAALLAPGARGLLPQQEEQTGSVQAIRLPGQDKAKPLGRRHRQKASPSEHTLPRPEQQLLGQQIISCDDLRDLQGCLQLQKLVFSSNNLT